jgi:cellobiose-specific phosphotransferase system component IIC
MKTMLIKFLILVTATMVFAEIVKISFNLMNQSNTYTFYLGLTILLTSFYICGYYGYKLVKNIIETLKTESSDENEK